MSKATARILRWLRDYSSEYSPSESLALDVNDALEDLLKRYPHDDVIAAMFAAMRQRCESPETFLDVAECAATAFGPGYAMLKPGGAPN